MTDIADIRIDIVHWTILRIDRIMSASHQEKHDRRHQETFKFHGENQFVLFFEVVICKINRA